MRSLSVVVLGLAFVGLGRAEDKIEVKQLLGKWEAQKVDDGTLPQGTIVEFLKEGKIKVIAKKGGEEETRDGTYKLEDKKLTVTLKTPDGEEKAHMVTIKKLSATEFVIEDDKGKSIEFTKKKD